MISSCFFSTEVCLDTMASLYSRMRETWWLNSLFISTTSFLNAFVLFFMMYLWTMNRQTHLKKTRGSVIPFKSNESSSSTLDEKEDGNDLEDERLLQELDLAFPSDTTTTPKSRRWSKLKPLQSDLKRRKTWTGIKNIHVEVDDDDDESQEFIPPTPTRRSSEALPSLLEEGEEQDEEKEDGTTTKPPTTAAIQRRSLLDIAAKVKVFSYLGVETMKECLNYAEYVDVPRLGDTLFERGKFDGSLYVVVSGQITCYFHEYPLEDDDDSQDNNGQQQQQQQQQGEGDDGCKQPKDDSNLLKFTSGPGDVVTPLLALLSACVWAQQQNDNANDSDHHEPLAIASGVSAVATCQDTRLIRIPPTCFAKILNKFPADVYRVAQTILCRTQRVTLQTLVKTLGLHKELMRRDGNMWHVKGSKEARTNMPEWQRISAAFHDTAFASFLFDMESIQKDASVVTAVELNVPVSEAAYIAEKSTIITIDPGETIIHTGRSHNAIYLLLGGSVEIGAMVRRNYHTSSKSQSYFYRYHNVEPGTILGRLVCFAGDASLFEARARRTSEGGTGCTLLKIPKDVFDTLVVKYPRAMTRCMEVILGLISPVVHLLNWNSEWLHVEPSEAIAHNGDLCDSIFMVLNGRLRASNKDLSPSALPETVEEYGRGKFIGHVGGLTESTWPHDVYAVRNSELVRVPIDVLLSIIRAHPNAGVHFAAVIASQVQAKLRTLNGGGGGGGTSTTPSVMRHLSQPNGVDSNVDDENEEAVMPSYGLNLATIAVVPLSFVDVTGFCSELVSSLNDIAPATLLTKSIVRQELGEKTYQSKNALHEMKITRFLGDAEEKHRLVVYRADSRYTWWTQMAITQADCILLLVRADEAPEKQQVERCLAWAHESMGNRIELVVISEKDGKFSGEDAVRAEVDDWTENREWITGSHRIRAPFDHYGLDFMRMCRRITGRSVGLTLGGGGARGLGHLGVIRALMEAGITVDMVGGTSQGAYIGALFAESPDSPDIVFDKAREMSNTLASMREKILDLTLPMTSMFSGYRFNQGIINSFGKTRIQDLVLNFFCVSVDIQRRNQVVHTKGLLWKFVRASMSLTGYLPPISENGSLLVDGGYLNVVPADVMRHQMRARTVIAVDVSPETERNYYEYGTYLSGWWLLWNSWNPFVKTVQVPSMGDISDTLRWVSSDQHRKQVVHETDLYLTPPVGGYGTLEYDKFDEIIQVSYEYAKPIVDEFVRQNPWLVTGTTRRNNIDPLREGLRRCHSDS